MKVKNTHFKWLLAVFLTICFVFVIFKLQEKKVDASSKDYAASSWSGNYMLLARLVSGEANGEPYIGQVGVASVILNRVKHPKFPNTVAGVIYQPGAFESVSNGQIWSGAPSRTNLAAAQQALNGWDPTYGSIYFWNPFKRVNPWIWTRKIVTQIGRHVFAK